MQVIKKAYWHCHSNDNPFTIQTSILILFFFFFLTYFNCKVIFCVMNILLLILSLHPQLIILNNYATYLRKAFQLVNFLDAKHHPILAYLLGIKLLLDNVASVEGNPTSVPEWSIMGDDWSFVRVNLLRSQFTADDTRSSCAWPACEAFPAVCSEVKVENESGQCLSGQVTRLQYQRNNRDSSCLHRDANFPYS